MSVSAKTLKQGVVFILFIFFFGASPSGFSQNIPIKVLASSSKSSSSSLIISNITIGEGIAYASVLNGKQDFNLLSGFNPQLIKIVSGSIDTRINRKKELQISFNQIPAKTHLTITIKANYAIDNNFRLELISLKGALVNEYIYEKSELNKPITISLSDISDGVFFVRFVNIDENTVIATRKVIKAN